MNSLLEAKCKPCTQPGHCCAKLRSLSLTRPQLPSTLKQTISFRLDKKRSEEGIYKRKQESKKKRKKENRKQKENKNSTKKVFSFFSWSLSWSNSCFLSCFLTFLFTSEMGIYKRKILRSYFFLL